MFEKYLEDYEKYLKYEKNYSNNTVDAYLKDITIFSNYIKKDLLNVNKSDIDNFLRSDKNIKSVSINHRISALKSFYNYQIKNENIKINPTIDLIRAKEEKKLPTYLTLEEVGSLLNIKIENPFDARNKAILELLYSSGLRISELCNMRLSNIDINECIVRIMGKGAKERIVPLGDFAIEAIKNYMDNYRNELNKKNSDYIFLNNRGDKISRQFIFKIIKKECLKKGIRKNVSPHTLRHTFATHLLKNGADLRIIQELLGHENIGTTQIYTHLSNDKLKHDYEEYFPRN